MTAFRNLASVLLLIVVSGCAESFYEVPLETPLQPKLDVTRFQRILIAGFVTGGTDEIDTNLETARLLRSQLRTSSKLEVIDAEVIELRDIAEQQADFVAPRPSSDSPPEEVAAEDEGDEATESEDTMLSEKDLEAYEHIFSDASYWRQLGEEFQGSLILTGTIHFSPHDVASMVNREREVYDSFGRRRVVPLRAYQDRTGYVLSPRFIFIDGSTGATLYTERHREEILYDRQQNPPALSSYFELMDRLMPSFLATLSTESIRSTRILLR